MEALFCEAVLGCPHLVLTNVSGEDSFASCLLAKFINDMLGTEAAGLLVLERKGLLPAFGLLPPVLGIPWSGNGLECLNNSLCIPKNGDIHLDRLVELGRVNINVNLLGVYAEFFRVPNDSVIPATANGDYQVRTVHSLV